MRSPTIYISLVHNSTIVLKMTASPTVQFTYFELSSYNLYRLFKLNNLFSVAIAIAERS